MRILTTLALIWVTTTATFAQDPADIFHKTIDLDSVDQVNLDVYAGDNFEIKDWPGDDILVETSVKLIGGKAFILDFFKEKQRYELEPMVSGRQMQLTSKDKTRRQVKGTDGQAEERVTIVLYMPDTFAESGTNTFRRTSK